jgi:hypothetical protein
MRGKKNRRERKPEEAKAQKWKERERGDRVGKETGNRKKEERERRNTERRG